MAKWAIVTGGGTGIGKASARRLATLGFQVLIIGRRKEVLIEACDELNSSLGKAQETGLEPGKVSYEVCDISQSTQVSNTLDEYVADSSFDLYVLVNNAGQFVRHDFETSTSEDWNNQFQVNLMGLINMSQWAWPFFKSQKSGQIINISSTLGLRPVAGTSAYSAIKAAVNNLTETMALEGAAHNIRVNCICPGLVDTPIHEFHSQSPEERGALQNTLNSLQPMGRMGAPEDIAQGVAFLASEENTWTTGSILKIDGGIHLTSKEP